MSNIYVMIATAQVDRDSAFASYNAANSRLQVLEAAKTVYENMSTNPDIAAAITAVLTSVGTAPSIVQQVLSVSSDQSASSNGGSSSTNSSTSGTSPGGSTTAAPSSTASIN